LEVEAFFGELIGDGTEFWAPVTAWAPPNWGVWVRLLRLWAQQRGGFRLWGGPGWNLERGPFYI